MDRLKGAKLITIGGRSHPTGTQPLQVLLVYVYDEEGGPLAVSEFSPLYHLEAHILISYLFIRNRVWLASTWMRSWSNAGTLFGHPSSGWFVVLRAERTGLQRSSQEWATFFMRTFTGLTRKAKFSCKTFAMEQNWKGLQHIWRKSTKTRNRRKMIDVVPSETSASQRKDTLFISLTFIWYLNFFFF